MAGHVNHMRVAWGQRADGFGALFCGGRVGAGFDEVNIVVVRTEMVGVRGEQWAEDILWVGFVFAWPVGVVAAHEETREKDCGFDVIGIVFD